MTGEHRGGLQAKYRISAMCPTHRKWTPIRGLMPRPGVVVLECGGRTEAEDPTELDAIWRLIRSVRDPEAESAGDPMTVRKAAMLLAVNRRTIYRMIKQGKLPHPVTEAAVQEILREKAVRDAKFLTSTQTAALLSVTTSTVWKMKQDGRLPDPITRKAVQEILNARAIVEKRGTR